MNHLNDRASMITQRFLEVAEELSCEMFISPSGSTLLDAGVLAKGSIAAGRIMAEICTATLAKIRITTTSIDDVLWPSVEISTDFPVEACYLSQSANWPIEKEGFRAMGSGPACLLNPRLEVGKDLGYVDQAEKAVLVVESRQMPNDPIVVDLAGECGFEASKLTIMIAPTSSLAGSVQIASRSIETALHKMRHLGFDIRKVISGFGTCPIAPPTGDDFISLGKTNDFMMYGSRVWLAVHGVDDQTLMDWAKAIPASNSPDYGEPFLSTLKKAGGFYKIDPGIFAPAEITLTSLSSGLVAHAGEQDLPRLRKAIF